ncbi:proteoglycan 4b [Heptranchias perlo]|uniref:proteoglycan 4b n=1 Tax=Heptranchias perlo TaxID=212740 RepID=UPI00355A2DD3
MKMASPQSLMTWSSILLIFSSFNLPKEVSAQDSCRGRCGNKYERGFRCHCDINCLRYGECCKDYRALCTSETSCSGRCWETHERGRKCQCDSKCMEYNECCPDFVTNCRKDSWKSPTTFMPTTRSTSSFISYTWKPSTAKLPEFISDAAVQQDPANFLDEKTKIMKEPTKPRNGSIKVIEESTTMNSNRFVIGKYLDASRPMENTMEDDPFVTEESSYMDSNLEIDDSEKSIFPEELVTMDPMRIQNGPTQPTFHDKSATINTSSLDKEGTQATVPERSAAMNLENMDKEGTQATILEGSAAMILANVDKEGTQATVPEGSAAMILENVDKEGTQATVPEGSAAMILENVDKEGTQATVPEGSAAMILENVDKEGTQATVPEESAAMNPEISQSIAPNRVLTVDPDNLDNAATIQSIPPEEAVTMLPNLDKLGITKQTVPEENATTNSKILDIEGTTKPADLEDTTTDFKVLDKEEMTKPPVPEDSTTDSKILDIEGTTRPADLEDTTTDFKVLDKEEMTKPPVPKDSTTDSKLLAKEGTMKPPVPEDSTTDSKLLDKEGTMKPPVPEDSTTDSKLLAKEGTMKPLVPEEDSTTDSKILDKEGTMKPLVPEEDSTTDSKLLAKEGTMKPLVPEEDSTTDSKILDKEETTKPTVPEEDSTIHLNNLHNKVSTQPTIPQEAAFIDPNVNKGMTQLTVPAGPVTIDPTLDKASMTQPNVLGRAVTVEPANLDNEGVTNTEESITMDSNILKIEPIVLSIVPDKYTVKDINNVTTPADAAQDSDDYKVTNVALPSPALRSQTTMKTPSHEDHLNDLNLCNKKPSDALTTLRNGTMYVFRGHLFWMINQKGQAVGYPRRISDVWGIPSPIDTVFTRCNCNGKTFFFKGEQYWRFQNGVMDPGYPRVIATGFSGLNGKIWAALSVAAHNDRPETVYFFKNGGRFQKYVYHQRSSTACPHHNTGVYTYGALRRRFKRQTMVVIQETKLQKAEQLSVEMSVRKYWRGFPIKITSAISFPNPERADKYEYFVLSGDKYYNVDPTNLTAINTRRSIAKDLYACH